MVSNIMINTKIYNHIPFKILRRYTVMSGTPAKMLEHLLETRLGQSVGGMDPFLDDFLLTHIVFMPVVQLVDELAN